MKDKARELVDKYYLIVPHENMAIKCALVAVDMIIKNEYDENGEIYEENNISYWQDVKKELEAMK